MATRRLKSLAAPGPETSVAQGPFVHRRSRFPAGHARVGRRLGHPYGAHSATPRAEHTLTALRTPSSWKPYPQ